MHACTCGHPPGDHVEQHDCMSCVCPLYVRDDYDEEL